MDTYEKKYNEALERARKLSVDGYLDAIAVEEIFPELAESEDERMCKRCIDILRKVSAYSGEEYLGVEIADCITGLQALRKNQKELFKFGRGLYYYDGKNATYCGYPVTEENPHDFDTGQQEKQKESLHISETCKDDDERIRKWIINLIKEVEYDEDWCVKSVDCNKAVAYLEKQKEQKPAEWSKEDENKIERLAFLVSIAAEKEMISSEECIDLRRLVKSYHPQSKKEWSEEDEKMIDDLIKFFNEKLVILGEAKNAENTVQYISYKKVIDWLKSLRPSWRPSEEQIYSLGTVVKGYDECTVGSVGYHLKEMYEQLKKLM